MKKVDFTKTGIDPKTNQSVKYKTGLGAIAEMMNEQIALGIHLVYNHKTYDVECLTDEEYEELLTYLYRIILPKRNKKGGTIR